MIAYTTAYLIYLLINQARGGSYFGAAYDRGRLVLRQRAPTYGVERQIQATTGENQQST